MVSKYVTFTVFVRKKCLFSGFVEVEQHIVVFGASSFRKQDLYGLLSESILLNAFILLLNLYMYLY